MYLSLPGWHIIRLITYALVLFFGGLCLGMTLGANFSNVPNRDMEHSVLEGGSDLETSNSSLKKQIGEYGKAGPGDAAPVPKPKVLS